jgi:hypothetical protein
VDRLALRVPILLLHRCSGDIAVEACRVDQYADCGGLRMVPAVFDGDVCVKLLLGDDWVATAQYL